VILEKVTVKEKEHKMNVDYEENYELDIEDMGYTHESNMPNLDHARDYMSGVLEALYETGDISRLEDCLDEVCHILEVKYEAKELKVESIEKQQKRLKNMENSLELKQNSALTELQNTQKLCASLMQTKHYSKIGAEGMYAIVEKAKSIGVSPLDALNGGMYYVQGKVELSAAMMNHLIRQAGHSITKDKRSNSQECILHGRRADNGDTWVESFSIEDAKTAGIYRGQWIKYPKDMLFARALSRLARQLFPDVIKGCYVQGEIEVTSVKNEEIISYEQVAHKDIEVIEPSHISAEQYDQLEVVLKDKPELRKNLLGYMQSKYSLDSLEKMPVELYAKAMERATAKAQGAN